MTPILEILELISDKREPVSIATLLAERGIPKATLNRTLNKLCDMNYVTKVKHGFYEVGPAMVALAASVSENTAYYKFRTVLTKLVEKTGLNAEIYSLTNSGAVLLFFLSGPCEFQVQMTPGWHMKAKAHPAVAFCSATYPDVNTAWGESLYSNEAEKAAWQKLVDQAETENFLVDRGGVRPELARAAVRTADGQYCIALSGLLSDLPPEKDDELKQIMHKSLKSLTLM